MRYVSIDETNWQAALDLIRERWLTTQMVIRGEVFDMAQAEGVLALEGGDIAGLVTYGIRGDTCEILSLDSLSEGRGVGTELVRRVLSLARERGCTRVIAVTTNDNLRALRFWQKRGFDMTRLYRGALDVSRRLKPEIPLIGEDGIPLRHEIELEHELQ